MYNKVNECPTGQPTVITQPAKGETVKTPEMVAKDGRGVMEDYMLALPDKVSTAQAELDEYNREHPSPSDTAERDQLAAKLYTLRAVKFAPSHGSHQIGVFAIADERDNGGSEIVMLLGTEKYSKGEAIRPRILGAVFRKEPTGVIYFVDEKGCILKLDEDKLPYLYTDAQNKLRNQVKTPPHNAFSLLDAYNNLTVLSDLWSTRDGRYVHQTGEKDYYAVARALYDISLRFFKANVPDIVKKALTDLYIKQPKPEEARAFDV